MTLQRDGEQPQAEVAALLRAVGQLLVAISGDEAAPAARPQPPARAAPPLDEVERILADARARAQQLIDESFADARAQIEALAAADAPPEEPPPAEEPSGELGEKLRSLQELLGDIDALQQAQAEEPAPPEPEAPEPDAAMEAPTAASEEPEAPAEPVERAEEDAARSASRPCRGTRTPTPPPRCSSPTAARCCCG